MALEWHETSQIPAGPLCRPESGADGTVLVGGRGIHRLAPSPAALDVPPVPWPIRGMSVLNKDNWWAIAGAGVVVRSQRGVVEAENIPGVTWDLVSVLAWPTVTWVTAATHEIWRWDGTWERWEAFDQDAAGLMWAARPDRVFVRLLSRGVGRSQGLVAIWDGASWTRTQVGKRAQVSALHGADEKNVWAVGQEVKITGRRNTVYKFDGDRWSEVDAPITENLHAVCVARPDEVWIGGDGGTLLRWDGKRWDDRSIARAGNITAIHCADDGALRVVIDHKRLLTTKR